VPSAAGPAIRPFFADVGGGGDHSRQESRLPKLPAQQANLTRIAAVVDHVGLGPSKLLDQVREQELPGLHSLEKDRRHSEFFQPR
jgi:hypothetical protein